MKFECIRIFDPRGLLFHRKLPRCSRNCTSVPNEEQLPLSRVPLSPPPRRSPSSHSPGLLYSVSDNNLKIPKMCSAIDNRCGPVAACLVLVLLSMVRFSATADVVDHCSQNNFRSSWNTTHMQYTKEPVHREYAVLDQFKSLHCCAKGYTSIEW